MKRILFPAALCLLASCSRTPPADEAPVFRLVPVLEIGVEFGDDDYVFSQIADAGVTLDGRILILDGQTCCISVYDDEGVFIQRAGGTGEAPGEFLFPSAMTVLSHGGVLVSDPMLSRMTIFAPDLTVDRVISGFIPFSPDRVAPARNGGFTGSHRTFDRENSLYGHLVGLWGEEPEPELIYYRRHVPFIIERVRESTTETLVSFTSGFDGTVYIAPCSETEYRVEVFDSGGELLRVIEEDREPRDRTPEEMEREREAMDRQLRREEAPPELVWSPASRRDQIPLGGLGIDNLNRLWVRDGREEHPVFDVYREDSFQFRAELTDPETERRRLTIKVTPQGILAWERNPEDYPRLFVLELVEDTGGSP